MRNTRIRLLGYVGLAALLALAGQACLASSDGSSSDTTGGRTCSQFAGALRSCGLLGEGLFLCEEPHPGQETCEASCLLSASCGDLRSLSCPGNPAGGPSSNTPAVLTCFEACRTKHGFACDDGQQLFGSDRCDGWEDCFGGEDELGCAGDEHVAMCADGSYYALNSHCDGFPDCDDGSDETDCPRFSCADGVGEVQVSYRCDDEDDCVDGSDEIGCAEMTCR